MKKIPPLWLAFCVLAPAVLAVEPILLDWGRIDTAAAEPQRQLSAARAGTLTSVQRKSQAGTVPWLVQFNDVIRESWKKDLTEAGAIIQGYIPENAFLVEATPEALARIAARPEVSWVGEYLPDYKRARPLRAALDKGMKDTRDMTVLLFNPADAERIGQAIAAMPGCSVIVATAMTDRGLVRAALTASAVEDITSWGEVEWIEPYIKPRLLNDIAVKANRMNVTNVWQVMGLTATGQIIAVCDTGLDTGNTNTIHRDFQNRVRWTQALGRAGDWSDTDGHGTHVAGSVLGSGISSTGKYRGVSYEAGLVFQSVLDSGGELGGLPTDLNELFRAAFTNGARIHSNSWGAPNAGLYDSDSRYTDMWIWSNKNMLVVFAAGNEGIDSNSDGVVDFDSMDTPGTAKNCLTVGASENYRVISSTYGDSWPSDFPANPINSDNMSQPDSPVGMVAFSSRGPCDDGRIKPDVVAPGTFIISTRSKASTDTGWGTTVNSNYIYMGGTSMATPLTSGAAGLVRQWLVTVAGNTNPSAAMMKALFINGSRDLAPGQYGTGSTQEVPNARPNNVQGWGHVNIYDTLNVPAGQFQDLYDTNTLATGASNSFILTVGSTTTNKFRVTMVYSDYFAASGAGKKLVNDLDLTIRKPGGTFLYANGRASVDATNNVEFIEFAPDETGDYSVRVSGRTVPSGGSQPYALVIRGFDTGAGDSLTVTPATNFVSAGPQGGPFTPTNGLYTLTNSGVSALTWTAVRGAGLTWLDLSRTNGTLAAGTATTTLFTVNASAASLTGGVYSGTVTFSNVTSGVAQSRTASLTVRPASQFIWNSIASPQQQGAAFTATVTAADSVGATVTAFTGPAALSGSMAATTTVGAATNGWTFPMQTYYHDARSQVIYLQSELGGATVLNGLALNVCAQPGQTLGNWTLRLKHTASSNQSPASWEGPASGWTTVYQGDTTVSVTGWVWFAFSTPFNYNGVSNLMVDFSYNNSSYTTNGLVRSYTGGVARALVYYSDSANGDPLDWSGSTPTPLSTNRIPNIRLLAGSAVSITPTNTGAFTNGVWSGLITVNAEASSMTLTATSSNGAAGSSGAFTVNPSSGVPVLTTLAGSNVTPTTAMSGGSISSDGGASVTARGVCWSTSSPPTTNDTKTSNASGTGSYSSSLTGLTPGQLYYVRAYAVNANGVGYGSEVEISALCFTNAPGGLSSSAVSTTNFTASWSALSGATSYRLDVSTNAAFTGGGGGGGSPYTADFEDGTKGSYVAGDVTLNGISWNLDGALIGTDSSDQKNGSKAARFSSSAAYNNIIRMNADTNMGLSSIKLLYGKYGTDANSGGQVEYSTDSGSSWVTAGTFSVTASGLTAFEATNLNASGTVRVRVLKTVTAGRFNVDDIQLYPYASGSSYVAGYENRTVGGTSQAVTGLTGDVTYYFRVRAEGAAACTSGNSSTQSVTTSASTRTITASAGAHGRIEPAGAVPVSYGGHQAFTVTASNLYRIANLTTNDAAIGVAFGNTSTSHVFTWTNVVANGAIEATFTEVITTNSPVPVTEVWLEDNYPGTNDYEAAALSDTDGDGLLAWEEYVAGTDPNSTNSTLAARSENSADTSKHLIKWLGSPLANRKYSVYWTTNLAAPAIPLTNATNLPSLHPDMNIATNASPPANPVFYRVRVWMEE